MPITKNAEIKRLLVFGAVGTLNTAACYVVFAILVHVFAWHYNLALVADYAFGVVLGYSLHRISTFADRIHVRGGFGKYAVTLVVTFALNLILLDWLVERDWFGPVEAQAFAMVAVTFASYRMQKHWVFRSYDPPAPATSA
ncbi:MAG TPA: GtrA family protein [Pirellulales bacterium]|jgi:putative flippase GtrA|nr:GtrA family protein [Pirellulales bacterium]